MPVTVSKTVRKPKLTRVAHETGFLPTPVISLTCYMLYALQDPQVQKAKEVRKERGVLSAFLAAEVPKVSILYSLINNSNH